MFLIREKIAKQLSEIRPFIYRETIPIPTFKLYVVDSPGAYLPSDEDHDWIDFPTGSSWGGYDVHAWFRTRIKIPSHFKDKELALHFKVGPRDGGESTAESLLYVEGVPLQGIDSWHEYAWLPPELAQKEEIGLALKAWSGVLAVPEKRRFECAELVWIDEPAQAFYHLAINLLESIDVLDQNDLSRVKLVQMLDEAIKRVIFIKPGSSEFYSSLQLAHQYLQDRVSTFQGTHEIQPKVTCVGQAHIDMAWLWRISHTREKAARTFSTVLHLMRQYPEYRFTHSSPQLFQYLKEDYPEIYARVKEKIADGQWEMTGGMWVESDTNLPSGESLIRQFLYGKRFAREEFGVEMNLLWLPDVFGYSGALPQIVKKCGLKYFLTTKLSWSQFNRFPYDTFYWRGIDGTELLTHFVTTPAPESPYFTYNGLLKPRQVKGIWENYQQKDANDELILLYGWGDGGGGPTQEMLEAARVLKDIPGMPKVELGSAESYFERLEHHLASTDLPVWDGELYLEYHRGTYTSQAANKRQNRLVEGLYHQAEWLCSLLEVLTGEKNYPSQQLQKGWELILLNQFHDILPGSSIREVYADSQADYVQIHNTGNQIIDEANKSLVANISTQGSSIVALNALSFPRIGLVELPWSKELQEARLKNVNGDLSSTQLIDVKGQKRLLLEVPHVPPLGYQTFPLVDQSVAREPSTDDSEAKISMTSARLENHFFRIDLNDFGQLTSIWDKHCHREVLSPGKTGNVFQAFEDKPLNFDAWDIDIYYQEKMQEIHQLVESEVEEPGPLRGVLRLTWKFFDSTITQRITLYRKIPRIDFRTEVDWHQQQVLLKVAFPVAIRAVRATYDIQFGCVERPTHWNTSWDYARFESVGHKWVDLSEGDYGVSLLNDCKYGHDIKNNVIRLTLIKSAIDPDKTADQGKHTFTYSLYPHAGDWRTSRVVEEANALNTPILAQYIPTAQNGALPAQYKFAEVDSDNIMIETIKKAEVGEAWIVRVYEFKQCRREAVHLGFGQAIRQAFECNLVEEDEHPVDYEGSFLTFSIKPFEIKTFKVWF